jgi:hypothetical protein
LIDGDEVVDFLLNRIVTARHSSLLSNQKNLAEESNRGNVAVFTQAASLVENQ